MSSDEIIDASNYQCSSIETSKKQSMPLAIIGMAARLPGEATTVDAFWDMLVAKRSAHSEVPGDRMTVDSFYDPASERSDSVRSVRSTLVSTDCSIVCCPHGSLSGWRHCCL